MTKFQTQLFINGAPRDSSDGRRIPQVNPATEEAFTEVASATPDDVAAAVEGAHQAFVQSWREVTPRKRADILFSIARVIREYESLALIFNMITVDAEQSIGEQHRQIRQLFLEGQQRRWSEWNTEAVAEWLALGGAAR